MTTVLLDAPVDVSALDFTTYHAYLDSVALPLIYYTGEGAGATTNSLPLRPVKQDTGQNPNEVRPEYGDYFAQSDFSDGSGQTLFHAPASEKSRYYKSDGFDISTKGLLKHLRATKTRVMTGGIRAIETADSSMFVIDGTTVKRTTDFITYTTDDPGGGVLSYDMTSSGDDIYTANAANSVYKRTGATNGWAQYVTSGAVEGVAWLKDRLMVHTGAGRSIHEITTGGAAIPSAIETLPVGWFFSSMWEAGAYIYASAFTDVGNKGRIHFYGLNSGGTAIEKKGSTPMPDGTLLLGGGGYVNTSFMLALVNVAASAYVCALYKATADSNGFLDYQEILRASEEFDGGTAGIGNYIKIKGVGNKVFVPWIDFDESASAGFAGLLAYDLARDAVSRHLEHSHMTRPSSVGIYKNTLVIGGFGENTEDKTKYVATASLVTSIADFNNAGLKVWDQVSITHNPLAADTSIAVYYTTKHPDENDWTLVGTSNTPSSTGQTFRLTDVESRIFALKFVSTANAGQTAAPEFLGYSVRSNPSLSTPEWVLTRYVHVKEDIRKTGGLGQLKYYDPKVRRKAIQDRLYDWVDFYEPDAIWNVRIEKIEDVEPGQPVHHITSGNRNEEEYVMKLTMIGTRTS